MANPRVFEFAKEVGMTPLALMDKIKEWQLPVKSHMAELEPEVLAQIKVRLSGTEKSGTNKSGVKADEGKKASSKKVTKKATPAPKVTEEKPSAKPAVAKAAQVKTSVIRRKKETESVEEPVSSIVENAAEEAASVNYNTESIPVVDEFKVEVSTTSAASKVIEDIKVNLVATVEPEVESPLVKTKNKPTEPESSVDMSPVVAEPVKSEPIALKPPQPSAPAAGLAGASPRKKEVVVGTSGIASNATPMSSAPRRNIVGRMDLSRVTPPPSQQSGGGGRYSSNDSGSNSGGGFAPRSGFQQRSSGTAGRNLRTGFVAAQPVVLPDFNNDDVGRKDKDLEKKNKKFSSGGVAAASPVKEREEEVEAFNAVEFRKRELVFQPKKKKELLNREALKTIITTPAAHKRVVKVNNTIKLSDLSQEMGLKAPQLIKVLMSNGVTASMNTDLDFDTVALIVPEFGWEAQNIFKTADEVAEQTAFGDLNAEPILRPPVVTVMGHVDHGKTSLLDAIRNTDVAAGEAGGITQHIGAYSVRLEDGHLITFLDTPGHEAFTAMRARGANTTDIAIIVVAADDGMMPQTQEAVNHAKAAGVPIIVAVNKIDKPGANVDRIKQQLTEFEIVPEEWGGSTIFCEVSALKRQGVKELLEQIRLVAELQELKANPLRSGTGVVIEAKVEKGRGPVATLLVKDGTVKVGQYVVAGSVKGRVRSLTNDRGERLESVGPGLPVEILGLESAPAAGDKFDVVINEGTADRIAGLRKTKIEQSQAVPATKMSLEDIFAKVKSGDVKELSLVLKADVHGSLEAIQGMLAKISTSEVKAKIIHAAVGGINESDVLLAHTAKGIVLGFNVRPDGGAQNKAKQIGVDIRTYSIVYELIDEMKKALGGLLAPTVVEKVMGRAEVRNIFTVPKAGTIAGCFIVDGKIQRSNMLRLIRDGKIVYEGKISSLKRFKDDAKEVASGFECGVGIENYNDLKPGDVIEAFVKEEIIRDLDSEASV